MTKKDFELIANELREARGGTNEIKARIAANQRPYEVFNLETDESHGTYESLDQARGCIAFDNLKAYSIWCGDHRIERCEPYEGNDDRVKEALGMSNASEQEIG